ncbi:Lrp/AsnC family transcriptional regulator [Nesterenkonia sp. K-15-9-6]|uniref:Lrp/AsnC family transcriptional regulator n=1 Tax=Nesterenkonia sp. K-15-9-6 TaxID=3093918 RepID=UPI004044D621
MTVLAEEDLRLIHALQVSPRASWTHLGTVLARHPSTLAARFENLRRSGAAWVTAHPRGTPDEMTLTLHSVICDPASRRSVTAALCALPEVYSVEESPSGRDLLLTVIVPHPGDLRERVFPLFDAIPGLLRWQTFHCTALHRGADDWDLGALSPDQIRQLRARPAHPQTPRSLRSFGPIVRILAEDGRASSRTVAARTGLAPTTARRRLHQVLASGRVSLRCDVAQGLLGYPLVCQWFARLPTTLHPRAAALLAQMGALRLCTSTTGTTNFLFMMWLRSAAEITEIEQQIEEALPSLQLAESVVLTHIPKRVGWALDEQGRAGQLLTKPADYW